MFNMLYPVIIILTVSTLHESYASWCFTQQEAICSCRETAISCHDQPTLTHIPNIPTDTTFLEFHGNGMTSLNATTLSRFTSLERLDLSQNKITSLGANSFSGLTSLDQLELQENHISRLEHMTFKGLVSLRFLSLQKNQMSTIVSGAFANLISLKYLYLQQNKITSIDVNTFSGITSFKFLRLHENHISSIEPGAFKGLGSLTKLSLNDNNLTTVSANLFDSSTNLKQLRLQGNLLMCCTMIDLIEWAPNQTRLSEFNGTCHDFNITTDINSFNSSSCQVDGQWGSWSTASCSVSCGDGIGSRKRNCESPKPSVDGKNCVGPSMESMICNLGECQVDGQWGSWSTASCSVSCGDGIGSRKRNCERPKPSVDGKNCVGPSMESMICNLGECQESCKESDKKSEWKKANEGKWRRNSRRQWH
ncbi:slit homolog 1 protein-like [Mytilus edulis]|uniref:slit homolog 1 protein-like n=1 Tax=Mytilus edulis TaxID=6550 RepID=UPI0039F04AE7